MRILSFIILCPFLVMVYRTTQTSPHGPGLKISCKTCHSTKGWQFDKEIYSFDHGTTRLPLIGQHSALNCRECHTSLIFSEARFNCIDCHKDVHQSTVGSDCGRCHTPVSWLVSNITEIHRMSRFPLVGAHRTAECSMCHKSENPVRFDVLGVDCIDCHRDQYLGTTNPDHRQAGFSEDCTDCHKINAFQWAGAGINHDFFPLTLGHSTPKCADCHKSGTYNGLSPECYSCHQADYLGTASPNHTVSQFPTNCQLCHSLNPGWKPADYRQHDSQFFPIYSGKHNGKWTSCADCHNQPSNYSVFTCISCHEHSRANTDGRHGEVNDYTYTATSCYTCHRTGTAED